MKPDFYIHSLGLDNGGGGPAVATPSKEEKQRTASKKEVSGHKREQDIAKMCDTFIPDNCEEVQSICQ